MADLFQPQRSTTRLGKIGTEKRRNPNNIDNMVVPPYGLPPDRNTIQPDDVSSYRNSDNKTEDI